MTDLRVLDLADEHLDGVLRVRTRSFGPMTGDLAGWRADALAFARAGRYLCVVADEDVVAAGRIWDFRQWWCGQLVPTAGMAGVVVAPEYRGHGVATLLMRAAMERASSLGFPLSALYPATVPLYRKLGYEYAGTRSRYTFDARALRALADPAVRVRRGGVDDADLVTETAARIHREHGQSGRLTWPEPQVREWLADDNSFLYLADDGFVVFGWHGSDVRVEELVAGSTQTARALWAVAASGASIAKNVEATVSAQDPVHLLVGEEARHEVHVERWMLRLLDAPAALAARGWPAAVEVDEVLRIEDPEMVANAGTWRLRVADGAASLTPTTGDGVVLDARGLAALYAGTPLSTLRVAGMSTGGDAGADHRLDVAFAGPPAFLPDYF